MIEASLNFMPLQVNSPSGRARRMDRRADGRPVHRLTSELRSVKLGVEAARGEQLAVGSAFPDPAPVQDEDLVGVMNGRQPVSDDQGGPAGKRGLERAL